MALDNREWALVIWLSIALVWTIACASCRPALKALLASLFKSSIVSTLALLFAYIALLVVGLWHLGWWEIGSLKTTLIWAFGSACVAVFNVNKVEDEANLFRRALGEVIGVAVVVDFLTAVDTFALWVEMLIFGSTFFLASMNVMSAKDPSLRVVHRGTAVLLTALGLLMLGKSIFHITTDFNDFASVKTVREFFLPIILGLLLLPFLFMLNAYMVAESVLGVFKLQSKNPKLALHAGVKLFRHMGIDMPGWRQWQRHVGRFPPVSLAEVNESVLEIKKTRRRQRNPHRVHPVIGWLPDAAIGFLAQQGLQNRPYYRDYEDQWRAASVMVELGSGITPNNVAYYLTGDEFTVKELKLKLNVNQPEDRESATEVFAALRNHLLRKALPFACANNHPFEIEVGRTTAYGGHIVSLKLSEWSGGIKGGFDLTFVIAMPESDQGV
ncbi:hypothetical protein VDF13_18230 [Xanthomonas campestris pv. raphani]|uniref:hypothetical protein n=1 Tax=Xanthomonas campestris TaxID=339 RepID=UPI001780C583|nr:hypothetical protein [Xanthomonas campestris]MCC8485792.1 hypothetical protein [Xanthomonas campestris]MDM7868226.1 hypothetical protein [Xanthomonas campestris pv. campestris]MEA9652037.1 hypothetical protein [Xanthomonas campestris pv. raphani]MEA9745188.1 hypothetical protein [Xanthomonas campestris pv. raphani]MEA9769233.1 hypothetical protein [Xanthomonas campestris pv. raphani]